MLTNQPGEDPRGADGLPTRAPISSEPPLWSRSCRVRLGGGTPASPSLGWEKRGATSTSERSEAFPPPGLSQYLWRKVNESKWTSSAAPPPSFQGCFLRLTHPGTPQGREWEGRPSRNQNQLLIGPDRIDLSRGAQKQTIPCKRLIINELLVLTTYRRQEGPALSFRPSTTGNQLGPASVGKGAMRSRLALPLLLLLCALLAEGKPDGRRKKGKQRPLGRGSPRAAAGDWEEGPAQTAPPPRLPRDKVTLPCSPALALPTQRTAEALGGLTRPPRVVGSSKGISA